MSDVTAVILCTSCVEAPSDDDLIGPCWRQLQLWLTVHGFEPLAIVDDKFSGTKSPQMIVGGAGYNSFMVAADFRDMVLSLPWERPEQVVLILQHEQDRTVVARCLRVE